MLSLSELVRAEGVFNESLKGAVLVRVVQDGLDRIAIVLSNRPESSSRDSRVIRLCVSQRGARLGELVYIPKVGNKQSGLIQYLKAHFVDSILLEIKVAANDRFMRLNFKSRDRRHALIFQILGPRSNLYALDENDLIKASLRPIEETRRDLELGRAWHAPEGRVPSEGTDRFASVDDKDFLFAIESHYGQRETEESEDRLIRQIAQALRRQRASVLRKSRKLQREQESGSQSEEFRKMGELLKGVLSEVVPGASEVAARDFESGKEVIVPLEASLSPSANLEAYFRRQRKAERQWQRSLREQDDVKKRLETQTRMEEKFGEVCASDDPELARRFAEETEVKRLLARFSPATRRDVPKKRRVFRLGKRELPTRLVPKCYRTAGDLEIWIGKNEEGNDVLTTGLARSYDMFFHLESAPGSHVILRVRRNVEPPQEALLDACELAVHFSKQRNASRASVHIARCKDISKPRGAKPGLVYVHRGRTLDLRRDPRRLEKILGARIGDIEDGSTVNR